MSLYGLIVGSAMVVGIEYFSRHQKIISKDKETFFLIGLLISAIIGARAYHVIDSWSYYSQNLWLIPQTWRGGLGIFGGIIGGLVFAIAFCLVNKVNLYALANLITPILPLCQSIGRWGNFANHEVYSLSGQPVWLYESVLDLCLFFLIHFTQRRLSPTGTYLVGYGLIRIFTETFRYDTWTINTIKVGQIIGGIFIILGVILICYGLPRRTKKA